jgi:hypothetical protein
MYASLCENLKLDCCRDAKGSAEFLTASNLLLSSQKRQIYFKLALSKNHKLFLILFPRLVDKGCCSYLKMMCNFFVNFGLKFNFLVVLCRNLKDFI